MGTKQGMREMAAVASVLETQIQQEVDRRVKARLLEMLGSIAGGPDKVVALPPKPAKSAETMAPKRKRRGAYKHAMPVITSRLTWTPAQLVRAGGARNVAAATKALIRLEEKGILERVARGVYARVLSAAPPTAPEAMAAPGNGIATGA